MISTPATQKPKTTARAVQKVTTKTTRIAGLGKALRVSEADIEKTCSQILEWDSWRSFKMEQNYSERKQRRTGEAGMPDRLYIRYTPVRTWLPAETLSLCEVMWIEWKALGGRVSQAQQDWQVAEVARGALVLCAGRTFPASIEGFKEFYKTSGLQRRK